MTADWTAIGIAGLGTVTTIGTLVATLRHQKAMVASERRYNARSEAYVDLLAMFYELAPLLDEIADADHGPERQGHIQRLLDVITGSTTIRARANAMGSEPVNDLATDVWEAVTAMGPAMSDGADVEPVRTEFQERLVDLMRTIRAELQGQPRPGWHVAV